MKKLLFILLAGLFIASCEDPEKDPLQFDKIKKGSLLALRGQAYENLADEAFLGGVDIVSKTADVSTETFEFEADFLSANQELLSSVDVYAKYKSSGTRVKVANVPGSVFVAPIGAVYRRGKITIALSEILKVTGKNFADLPATDFDTGVISNFVIESDINLTDGTLIPSSSIVNSSLYESDQFYPAHSLSYYITK